MNVLFLRANHINPNPRVQKEMYELSQIGFTVSAFGWDRSYSGPNTNSTINVEGECFSITRCNIKAKYGGSFIEMINPLLFFQYKILMHLILNKNKYDILHAFDFDTAFVCLIFAKIFKKKLVYDICDYYPDAFNIPKLIKPIIIFLDKLIINNADSVIICTEFRKKQIPLRNAKKVFVVQNSHSIIIPKICDNTKNNNKLKVAYFGILQPGRLIDELVDIIIRNKNIELHIGGFGILEDSIKKISLVNQNIIYYGCVNHRKVIEIENMCDIITAIYDPNVENHKYAAPNKFYEAMALGKPMIVCKNTYIDTIVDELGCGLIIDYSKLSLEKALLELLTHIDKYSQTKEKISEYYEQNLSWKISKKELENLYTSLDK